MPAKFNSMGDAIERETLTLCTRWNACTELKRCLKISVEGLSGVIVLAHADVTKVQEIGIFLEFKWQKQF